MRRELDSRMTPEGDTITLWWDDETDEVQLVIEPADGEPLTIDAPRERAHDAFWHPWAYAPAHAAA